MSWQTIWATAMGTFFSTGLHSSQVTSLQSSSLPAHTWASRHTCSCQARTNTFCPSSLIVHSVVQWRFVTLRQS